MRRAFRLTKALYPAMGIVFALALCLSSRVQEAPLAFEMRTPLLRDRVFPFISYRHGPGEGTFLPGAFALNFFGPSVALMGVFNLFLGDRVGPLLAARANVFTYLFVLLVAIGEIGTDTVLPLLSLPGPWHFPLAISITHLVFMTAVTLAAIVTKGADREW